MIKMEKTEQYYKEHEAAFKYGILFGLCADIFQFDKKIHISNQTHDYFIFKPKTQNG